MLRTALCRAVIPSFVRKSRCAPPFFSTLMRSAHPSSCAASVRGLSATVTEGQANDVKKYTVKTCTTFNIFENPILIISSSLSEYSPKLLVNFNLDNWFSCCDCFLVSQLHCQTTGHPTGKSPLWPDGYLHKLEKISGKHNPVLASMQMAYFRKSVNGHFVVKAGREKEEKTYTYLGYRNFHTSCVWIMEVGVQAFIQKPWNLFCVSLLDILHKLFQISLMEIDKGKGRVGAEENDSYDCVMKDLCGWGCLIMQLKDESYFLLLC